MNLSHLIWAILTVIIAIIISCLTFPFTDITDQKSHQFEQFEEEFQSKNDDKKLGHAADYIFTYFSGTIIKLVLIITISISLLATINLLTSKQSSTKQEKKLSIFIQIGISEHANKTCISAQHSLSQALNRKIKYAQNINPHYTAANYIRSAYAQMNILTLISIQNKHGLNSFMQKMYRFYHSYTWNVFMNVCGFIHIAFAFTESSMRMKPDKDCVDFFALCNLQFKPNMEIEEQHTLTQLRLITGFIMIFYCIDVIMRGILLSSYTAPWNVQNSKIDKIGCIFHVWIIAQFLIDNIVLELFMDFSLEFLLPTRAVLLVIRSPRLSKEVVDMFAAMYKARYAVFFFVNIVLISSIFSMILFGNTWEYEAQSIEDKQRRLLSDYQYHSRRLLGQTYDIRENSRHLLGEEGEDIDELVENALDDGIPGIPSNLFSDVIRSFITMFIMIISGENLVDLVYGTWNNPVFGKSGVFFYWWFIILFALFILTPIVVAAFCDAYEEKREAMICRRRAIFRTGVIASFVMIDRNGNGILTEREFIEFMHTVADMNDNELRKIFKRLDSNCSGTIDVTEFVNGVDIIFDTKLFERSPESKQNSNSTAYLWTILQTLCNFMRLTIIFAQIAILCMLSRGIYGANPMEKKDFEEKMTMSIKLDTILFAILLIHFIDVMLWVLCGGIIRYFYPTIYEKTAKDRQILNVADFMLVLFSFSSHLMVIVCYKTSIGGNNNDEHNYWYIPWHNFKYDDAVYDGANLVELNRIWMCLSIMRLFFVTEYSRKIIYTLIASMMKMMSLFTIMFSSLFAFGVIGVTLFRKKSDYNNEHTFDNLSSAFATFSQLQVGEAFYEILYQSIIWKKSWIPVLYFMIFHFVMAFLFADLFFGLLLEISHEFIDDQDDEDDEDETQDK